MPIPPGAQRFLSPAVWRQLTCALGPPRRGVLLNAQERLRSLLFLVSTYLPAHLVQQKMRRPVPGQVDGRLLSGSFLFSDVSGFTALSERLAVHADGAERLTTLINAYLSAVLRVLSQSGGILVKFAGDALLAYFPTEEGGAEYSWSRLATRGPNEDATQEAPRWAEAQVAGRAARAAWRMMEAMNDVASQASTGAGSAHDPMRLSMKIGLGTGDCLAAAVGDQERMEYFLLGGAVERMMAAESHALAGQVVCDAATARAIESQVGPEQCWQVQAVTGRAGFYTLQLARPQPEMGTECGDQSTDLPAGDGLGDFEVAVRSRRARGALPLEASHHAVAAQMEVTVRQIEALVPFLAPELVERIVAGAERRRVESEYRPAVVMFVSISGPEQLLPAGGAGSIEAPSAVRAATRLLDGYFRAMQRVIADHGGIVARVDPYGGGSKMLVLFGAPVKHEDDTARAVGTALAMNEALATINRRHQRRAARTRRPEPGNDDAEGLAGIRHRIGINRGRTYAGQAGSNRRREYTVMGDDVNLAARLMGAAQWGQILVSRAARDEVEDRFIFATLAPIKVKGKRDPVEIFEAQAERTMVRPEAAVPCVLLVGRESELAVGEKALDGALEGRGGILVIDGAAGIGKSCLARRLAASAQERGAQVLAVECRAYAAAPYAPWCALLHDLFDVPLPHAVDDKDGTGRQGRLLAALDRLGIDVARHTPALATLMGIPTVEQPPAGGTGDEQRVSAPPAARGASRPTLFARLEKQIEANERAPDNRSGQAPRAGADGGIDMWHLVQGRRPRTAPESGGPAGEERLWHRLQERVASRQQARLAEALADAVKCASAATRPVVVVIDHAQWLDDASRALLDLLLERLAGARVLVVLAGRLEGADWLDPILARGETGVPPVTALKLGPLDALATARLARHWLGDAAPEYLAGVDEATDDRLFRRSGGNPLFLEEMVRAMVRHPGRGADAEDSLDDGPEYLAGLVLSRVDALPVAQREVVRMASVAGDAFRQSEVEALLEAARPDILRKSKELVAARTDPGPSSVASDMLANLVASDLLAGGRNGGDPIYAFRQSVVREVIYRSHSFAMRRELHRVLAECLAAKPGSEAALLAHHYELAGLPWPAASYLLESARRARALYAYGRAAADCERALGALAGLPQEGRTPAVEALEEALRVEQGDARLLIGDSQTASAAYGQAVAPYEQPGQARQGAEIVERRSAGATAPARLSWRLALALAGSEREADALARAEQAWTAAGNRPAQLARPGRPDRSAACQAIDRLAAAATLAWLLQRAGDTRAPDWIERTRSLGCEAERECGCDQPPARRNGRGAEIERLVSLVEEVPARSDEGTDLALILAALNEVYEAYAAPGALPTPGIVAAGEAEPAARATASEWRGTRT